MKVVDIEYYYKINLKKHICEVYFEFLFKDELHFLKRNVNIISKEYVDLDYYLYNPETIKNERFEIKHSKTKLTAKNINSARKLYKELLRKGFREEV
jgi:hypothetical protein